MEAKRKLDKELFDAVEQNNLDKVKRCFCKSSILARNNDGKSPIDVALHKGYLDIVEWYTFEVGKEYEDNGRYDEVIHIYDTVVNSLKDENIYLHAHFHKGIILGKLGKHEDAMEVFQNVYDERKAIFGLHNRKTADAGRNLGVACRRLGKYKEALEYDKLAYNVLKKLLGEQHWLTLDIQHNIAVDLKSLGETEEALKIYGDVLRLRKEVLGPGHRETKRTENKISDIHYGSREQNLDDMEEYSLDKDFQEIMDAIKQNNGDKVKNFFHNRSGFLIRNNDGKTLLDVALDKGYSDIVRRYVYELGAEYFDDGSYDEVMQFFQAELDKLMDDEIYLVARFYLGKILQRQKKYEEAIKVFQDTYKESKDFYGSNKNNLHPAKIGHCLAQCFRKLGKDQESLEINREVYDRRGKNLGYDHPLTLKTQHSIAVDLMFLRKYDEALKFFDEVLRIRKKVLGSDHVETIRTQTAVEMIRSLKRDIDVKDFINKDVDYSEKCKENTEKPLPKVIPSEKEHIPSSSKISSPSVMPSDKATDFSNKEKSIWNTGLMPLAAISNFLSAICPWVYAKNPSFNVMPTGGTTGFSSSKNPSNILSIFESLLTKTIPST